MEFDFKEHQISRIDELLKRLSEGSKALISSLTNEDLVGSLNFWFDDYGSCLFVSRWKLDEVCWSPSIDNNFELPSEFDIFDDGDKRELTEIVSRFLKEVSQKLSERCRVRHNFQWSVSCFETPSFLAKGDKIIGATDEEVFGPHDAKSQLHVLIETLKTAFESRKITTNILSAIKFSTDEKPYLQLIYGEEGDDYEVFVANSLAFGYALNGLALGGEEGFAQFANSISDLDFIAPHKKIHPIKLTYCFSNIVFDDREFDDLVVYEAVLS